MNQKKLLLPALLVFLLLNALFIAGAAWFKPLLVHTEVLIIANLLFFVLGLVAFVFQLKALKATNPHAFVRHVMGGTFIKLLVGFAALGVYALAFKNLFNKPTAIGCMLIYIVYLVTDTMALSKVQKKQRHG
jgi:hypothetical protein